MTGSVAGEMYEWMYVFVMLPWEVMRRILCRPLHSDRHFHEFRYAAATFFFCCHGSCERFPNNEMQCKPYFDALKKQQKKQAVVLIVVEPCMRATESESLAELFCCLLVFVLEGNDSLGTPLNDLRCCDESVLLIDFIVTIIFF